MLALRFYDRRDIRLEEVPIPETGDDEVLIRVTDAGISQTQINEFIEGPFIINKEPHPLTGISTPLIPSQEYGGIVEAVGKNVDKSLIGKQVAVLPLISCGECEYCKNKEENRCNKVAYYGLLGAHGGFAEYCVVNKNNIFPVSDRNILTFIEPILVGIHSAQIIKNYTSLENKKILILGAGAVGISIATVFRDYFKADIQLNDILDARLKKAQKAGFETVKKENITGKYDVVIDAAGMDPIVSKPALIEGFNYLKKGGFLLNIGTYFHTVEFIPSSILIEEKNLITSIMYNSKTTSMLKDVVNSIKVDFSYFIDRIPLRNIIEEGYFRAEVDKESFVRIVVEP